MERQGGNRPAKQAYLRVSRGLLEKPSLDRGADGRELVRQCLEELQWEELPGIGHKEREDQENFPPRLFVLLATVALQPFEALLAGIRKELAANSLADVPLIGCSVAGVLTEDRAMLGGAALVCIGSRFVRARIDVTEDVTGTTSPFNAAALLCQHLGLTPDVLHAKRNAFLLCFLPGFKERGERVYRAPEIYKALRDATGGLIPMVGGVAGDDFQRSAVGCSPAIRSTPITP